MDEWHQLIHQVIYESLQGNDAIPILPRTSVRMRLVELMSYRKLGPLLLTGTYIAVPALSYLSNQRNQTN